MAASNYGGTSCIFIAGRIHNIQGLFCRKRAPVGHISVWFVVYVHLLLMCCWCIRCLCVCDVMLCMLCVIMYSVVVVVVVKCVICILCV